MLLSHPRPSHRHGHLCSASVLLKPSNAIWSPRRDQIKAPPRECLRRVVSSSRGLVECATYECIPTPLRSRCPSTSTGTLCLMIKSVILPFTLDFMTVETRLNSGIVMLLGSGKTPSFASQHLLGASRIFVVSSVS